MESLDASERLARQLMAEEALEAHAISQHVVMQHDENFSEEGSTEFCSPSTSPNSSLRQREIEESERLARQLMAEEAMEAYATSQRAMLEQGALLEHAGDYSEEDLQALRALMAEEDAAHDEPDSEDEEENEDVDYERLLQLGEMIGDVKEERWKMRAQSVIDCLPTRKYKSTMSESSTLCTICQCDFEPDEELRILPCKCFFHKECGDGWLKRKGSCPNCKMSIEPQGTPQGKPGRPQGTPGRPQGTPSRPQGTPSRPRGAAATP